jgi:type IV secretion system protein VirB1
MIPGLELAACGPLAVPAEVMEHVVHVESSRNPFAIGVVGGRLLRQPRSLAEASATMRMLEENGYNYSIGLAQVNRINFERFGLDSPEKGFDVCNNLAAGASILSECLQRHEGRWGDAFSCYYSGNARTGYEHGYVQKVFGAMATAQGETATASAIPLAPSGGTGSTGGTHAPTRRETSWDAVYAARISAPEASRAQPVQRTEQAVREQALVSAESVVVATPVATDVEARPGRPAVAPGPVSRGQEEGLANAGTSRDVVATPEARLIEEMRQQLAGTARSPAAQAQIAAAPEPAETVVENQETSNLPLKDDARVF